MKLNNIVWVTGAGHRNGLGYAISEALEADNFCVKRFDVSIDSDLKCDFLDITDENAVASIFNSTKSKKLPMAIVNCAGVNITGEFIDYPIAYLEKTLRVNVVGTFIFIQNFVRHVLNFEGLKYIVNIGSDSANTPRTNSFAYCASKAGIQMFTRCFARDLAKWGFRTVEIDPSLIADTNMDVYINDEAARLSGKTPDEIKQYRLSKVPLGRFATTQELAKWVPFIIKNGEYANGSCIRVTGGVV